MVWFLSYFDDVMNLKLEMQLFSESGAVVSEVEGLKTDAKSVLQGS